MGTFKLVKLLDQVQIVNIMGGIVPRGAYDPATDYAVGDLVTYNGSSYVMYLDAVAGTLPTNTTYWQVVSGPSGAGGGITRSVNVTSGSYTLGSTALTDYVYLVAGSHAGTLPTASSNSNQYTIKNNHSADITVTRAGSDTIEGTTSITIAPEDSVDLISNGTNAWSVI